MANTRELTAARATMRSIRMRVPHAVRAEYAPRIGRILVTLSDGFEFAIDPARTQTLASATTAQLKQVEIQGAGYELYFPKLDDGVWIPGLLQGLIGSRSWMRAQEKLHARQKQTAA